MSVLLRTAGLAVTIAGISVCRGLDLQVAAGELWGVLGRNGSGKSTLLHTLAGLRSAQGGEVVLGDRPLQQLSRRAVARRLGLLLQEEHDEFPGNVLEAVLAGRYPHLAAWRGEGAHDHAQALAALHEVGLDGFAGRELATLSGGERQRVSLARLLVQEAALWLLDEPTSHLDPHHQRTLFMRLRSHLSGGGAALMVIHDVQLAARYCDRLLLLYGDGDLCSGDVETVLTESSLQRLYGVPMVAVEGPHGPLWVVA